MKNRRCLYFTMNKGKKIEFPHSKLSEKHNL
jgi:hypothetical protein